MEEGTLRFTIAEMERKRIVKVRVEKQRLEKLPEPSDSSGVFPAYTPAPATRK